MRLARTPRRVLRRDNPGVTTSPRFRADQGVVVVAGSLGIAYALAAIVIARSSGTSTTYAGHTAAGAWLFVAAGIGLFAAAMVTRTRRTVAVLAVLAGVLWFAPLWEGWEEG